MYLLIALQIVGTNLHWTHIGYFSNRDVCMYSANEIASNTREPIAKFLCVPTTEAKGKSL